MTDAPHTRAQPRLSRRFLRDWLAPQWRWFLLGGILSAITAVAAAGYVQVVTWSVDWLESADTRLLTVTPLAILALVVIRSLAMYAQTQANNHGVQNAMVALQQALFSKLIGGDLSVMQASASGGFVSRFVNDVTMLREASLRVFSSFAKSTLTLAAAIGSMIWLDWQIAVLLLVVYPIAFYPVIRLGERIRKSSRRAQEQAAELTSLLSEAFRSGRTVKAFRLEDYQRKRSAAGFSERARLYMKVLRSKAIVDPFLEILGGLALAGLFAFAGWRAASGDATVGTLIGFVTAIGVASPEVRALGTLNSAINEGLAAAERLYAVLDQPDRITDKPGATTLTQGKGEIAFDNVRFSYSDGATVLDGLSFRAEPGRMIAFVGPSGGGKSTIFNLALRLYDPQSGIVRIDGHDVRDLQLASARAQIALVSQDAFLFDASLRENILLGRPDATPAEVEAAAAAASCDFLNALPGGLDAPAGEGGANLSGGQRQRIALARALLSNAPILLLDEATSALDSESEARVQTALAALAGRKTLLVIAHRLATVRKADVIHVVDAGRITETGTHDQLMRGAGAYARLAAHQLS